MQVMDANDGVVQRLRAAGCVFAEQEAALLLAAAAEDPQAATLEEMVAERVSGTPLEYILGWAEFLNLRITVSPGVFVPRQRTRYLAELALHRVKAQARNVSEAAQLSQSGPARDVVVLEMCCGTGAVATVLAAAVPSARVYAADIDPAAVECAQRNLGARGQVYCGDLFAPLPQELRGRVDVLVANAPYVPTEQIALMPPEARLYEARAALDGGPDGVTVQERVAFQAMQWLAPQGRLLMETSRDQAPLTAELMERAGLRVKVKSSKKFYATVLTGTLG